MLAIAPTFDSKRTIPSPEVTKIMMEMLQLTPKDKVLEIGTGSGYQTGRLAESGAEIHTIELEPFIDTANHAYGFPLVYLHTGDGKYGLEHEAPFTAIVATCGVKELRKEWIKQTAPGGRIVAPIGDAKCQRLTLYRVLGYGEVMAEKIAAYVRFQMLREN